MAKKKKKWKSRIKKALKLAAIGGAGYLAAKAFGGKKKFGTDAGFLKSGAAGGASLSTPPILGTDHITKKAPVDNVVVDAAPKKVNLGNTRLSRDGVTPGMVLNARRKVPGYGTAVAPPGILNPYKSPIGPGTGRVWKQAKGGRIGAKKGGRVTGIAKRGFGRALMKGKK